MSYLPIISIFLLVIQSYAFRIQLYARSNLNLKLPTKDLGQFPLRKSSFESRLFDSTLSLGAPSSKPQDGSYLTSSGVYVNYKVESVKTPESEVENLIENLNNDHGVLLSSSYEYPGRYARWTVGFTSPAIKISGKNLDFEILALNDRGKLMLDIIMYRLKQEDSLFTVSMNTENNKLIGKVIPSEIYFPEELRSKQPSLFSLVRSINKIFYGKNAGQLGLYGALGYDLAFQFEPVKFKKPRLPDQQDMILYIPDEIFVMDNQKKDAWKIKYEFSDEISKKSTINIPRLKSNFDASYKAPNVPFDHRDNQKGDYAKWVVKAKDQFRVGNLFEVVLSQIFREKLQVKPSEIFQRLSRRNPSPYGFFMNLGNNEYLVGASPEMFVRVETTELGLRVETCPISGTIERGGDPLEDALQIKKLLSNPKEESELTMCTDVDRNDKSRICKPGSVKVLGRRQIEVYSKLIHTVDHVEGYLRDSYDALDAFLCHTWAVTVTGAPKTWALRFIEDVEPTPRIWYGGAVGMIGFDGTMNTGLTLRTIRVKDGIGEVRAGATLLHDSPPEAEEAETELKASAMLDAITRTDQPDVKDILYPITKDSPSNSLSTKKVLLIDHEDSFVHTLANYLRQTGAEVVTCRSGSAFLNFLKENVDSGIFKPDLAVLSPGPGSPSDFKLSLSIEEMIKRKVPIFGVCLGLQGLVEYFGGKLNILDYPMHGKPSTICRTYNDDENNIKADILREIPTQFQVARYHSLYGELNTFPKDLKITALTDDQIVMAIQHKKWPIAAVQFHPESILTLPRHGMKIISNALEYLTPDLYD